MHLPTIRQIQILADLIVGKPVPNLDPNQLITPWAEYYTYLSDWIERRVYTTDQLSDQFFDKMEYWNIGESTHLDLVQEAIDSPTTYPDACQVFAQLPDHDWLWPGWIPRGLWTLLAAEPGTGKTYLALDLALRIVNGSDWPDGSEIKPGPVLWIDAENRPSILKQRLSTWTEPQLERLYLMLADPNVFFIDLDEYSDRDRLVDMMWTIRPILAVVDSYGAASSKGENAKEDVQRLLSFLNQLVTEFNCGMLVIHHLRKAGGNQVSFAPMNLNDVRGSGHIGAMASAVMGLQWVPTAANPDPNGPRKLWCLKSNISLMPEPIGVHLDPHADDPDVAQVTYGDAPLPYKKATKTEMCQEWLIAFLIENGEPCRPDYIQEMAKDDGFSRATLYRAHKALGDHIKDTYDTKHPENKWELINDSAA